MQRHVILVLGMHRSGTSALTRMINLLGAVVPGELMPAAEDNPGGYWESRPIARFNSQLLLSAGSRWNDDAAIAAEWFNAGERRADRATALQLLEEAVGDAPVAVLKDPRLCRLLPFWLPVLKEAGREVHAVLQLREPLEVIRSLQARLRHEPTRPAAIAAESRGLLLWLRHVLDAEHQSRGLPRAVLRYEDLLRDWRGCFETMRRDATLPLPPPDAATSAAIDAHLDPGLRRQRPEVGSDAPPLPGLERARELHRSLPAGCDQLRQRLEPLLEAYAPLRREAAVSRDPADPWGRRLLTLLDERLARDAAPALPLRPAGRRVLFVSSAPRSAGHVYRVEQPLQALRAGGWQGEWCEPEDPQLLPLAAAADLVCVFRTPWGPALQGLGACCRQSGIPLVVDIDDLIFDRELMEQGAVEYVEQLPAEQRQRWFQLADAYRDSLRHADAVVVPTAPLAAAVAALNRRVHVLSNGLSEAMLAAAATATAATATAAAEWAEVAGSPDSGGPIRLGFASGTPTHQRDFAVVAEPLARLLERHADLRLVLVGHIDPAATPCLAPWRERIEQRPRVPLLDLHGEMARFSINLAPLAVNNPFNAGKSAIRVTTAAAVGVPSVASPTPPLQNAIMAGHSGLIADTAEAWETALEQLLADPDGRAAMGRAARLDVIQRYGWPDWAEQARAVYARVLAEGSTTSGGIHMASP